MSLELSVITRPPAAKPDGTGAEIQGADEETEAVSPEEHAAEDNQDQGGAASETTEPGSVSRRTGRSGRTSGLNRPLSTG